MYQRWTLSFGDDDEAIDVLTADTHECAAFMHRLAERARIDVSASSTDLPPLAAIRLGERGVVLDDLDPSAPQELREWHELSPQGIQPDLIARLPAVIARADKAFWAVIAHHLPEVKTGDVGPDWIANRRLSNVAAVASWIRDNTPYAGVREAYINLVHELEAAGFNPVTIDVPDWQKGSIVLTVDQDGIDESRVARLRLMDHNGKIHGLDSERTDLREWVITFEKDGAEYTTVRLDLDGDEDRDDRVARKVRNLFNAFWGEPPAPSA